MTNADFKLSMHIYMLQINAYIYTYVIYKHLWNIVDEEEIYKLVDSGSYHVPSAWDTGCYGWPPILAKISALRHTGCFKSGANLPA